MLQHVNGDLETLERAVAEPQMHASGLWVSFRTGQHERECYRRLTDTVRDVRFIDVSNDPD